MRRFIGFASLALALTITGIGSFAQMSPPTKRRVLEPQSATRATIKQL